MCDCHVKTGLDADSRLERAVQKLEFLGGAIPGNGIVDNVMSFDQARGLATMLDKIASDIEAIREWQHNISQKVAETERLKSCGTFTGGTSLA